MSLPRCGNHRDQRLLNTARMEVEKCAVVRTLVKQKGHLQKMLARQERELEAIKQTQVRVLVLIVGAHAFLSF